MNQKDVKCFAYQRMDGKAAYQRSIRILGKKIKRTFSRKTDADRWYEGKKREKELIENGLQSQISQKTVEDFVKEWMENRKRQGKPMGVWSTDEARMRLYILPAFGKRYLHHIQSHEWEKIFDDLVPKISNATRNRIRALICKLYSDAVRSKIAHHNPISEIPKLPENTQGWDYFETQEECQAYLSAAQKEGPGFFIFAMLALNTGMRLGENIGLYNKDVNLPQRLLHIMRIMDHKEKKVVERTKSRQDRWLGVNDQLFNTLMEHRQRSPGRRPNDTVVYDLDGQPFNEWRLRKIHVRVCKNAKVKRIRVHDLRHTYASHYVMNGGTFADLQALLGHSTQEMTQKYAHLAPRHLAGKSNVVSMSCDLNVPPVTNLNERRKGSS